MCGECMVVMVHKRYLSKYVYYIIKGKPYSSSNVLHPKYTMQANILLPVDGGESLNEEGEEGTGVLGGTNG
jgi:hypothetical protein